MYGALVKPQKPVQIIKNIKSKITKTSHIL